MFQKFIKACDEYTTREKHIPAPYIRKAFELDFKPEKANVSICTPGLYTIYINGEDITKGFLAPYISNPDDFVCYDEYDISRYLRKGKNCIAFILGNGFANQTIEEWEFSKASFRAPLCSSVYLTAKKAGDEFILKSDESFKTHPSPIVYDEYRNGTHYDARLEIDSWNLPEFDDSGWENVMIADAPKGELVKCTAHPIREQYRLSPESVVLQEDFCYFEGRPESHIQKGFIYDFGLNRAGVCRLKIKGKKGQKIILRHGEATAANGKFSIDTIFFARSDFKERMDFFQTDVYILKGTDEEEIYIPPFTYHGFRYVSVEGITEEQATKDLLTYIVFNSDVRRRAYFECSDETVNKLYDMAIAADLSNLHYFPTDCPQREKNGWTGDMSASAEQYSLHFDYADTMKLWLKSLECAQKDGVLPGIVPTTGVFYDWGNGPVWDSACVNVPYYIYKYDGRRDVLEQAALTISRYLRYIAGKRDEYGFITFGLGDWSQAGSLLEEGITTPLAVTGTGMMYDMAKKAAFIFDVLCLDEEKAFANKLADEAWASMRAHLIDYETMTVAGSCQTAQAFFISLGIFEENEYERAYSRLLEFIEEKGRHLHCGVVGLRHIIEVLFNGGDADLALEMMCQKTSPSYAWMIEQGGTALFEMLEETIVNKSQNHHFLGDYIRVFVSCMAGIKVNPYLRDTSEILISPIIPESISHAKGSYETTKGLVSAEWRKMDGKIEFIVENRGSARVTFEYGNVKTEVKSGERKEMLI